MDVDGRVSGAYCRVLIPQRCRAGNRSVQRSHACTGVSPQGCHLQPQSPASVPGFFVCIRQRLGTWRLLADRVPRHGRPSWGRGQTTRPVRVFSCA
ncbi:hypothetical protein FA516_12720 [Pseudomonas aeruginosa]|nr:hypothetical protein BHE76_15710 [Pseudomonas aeruginosa]OHP39624.1 hypothetical protein HMPREF2535_07115 [Pseudomonas sp. HMSC060F12]ARH18693.1 hypothetical protein HV96_31930 [Pseudomonas aeruginosa]AXC20175.1 hypothetical protein CWE28_09165 [Pseudomonas aeruginosa]KSF13245.1 hypothetical protein AO929_23245 [Pseudomonas aeruginosa]